MDEDDNYDEHDELFGTSHLPRVSSEEVELEPPFQQFICPNFDEIDELLKASRENGATSIKDCKTNSQNENDSPSTTGSTLSTSPNPSREMSPTPPPQAERDGMVGGEDKGSSKNRHSQSAYQLSSSNGTNNVNVRMVNGHHSGSTFENHYDDEAEAGNQSKKIFSKAVPMDPNETWDFSLRSFNPDYKSKCLWLEGSFYKKLHDECLHEMHYIQCPCDERKRVPICRICHIPFCSTGCFKRTSRSQMGIKTNTEEMRPSSSSTLEAEQESPAQHPMNETKNLKPASNRRQSSTNRDDNNSNVASDNSLYKENRKVIEAAEATKEGTRKPQNHRQNQRDQFRGGDSGNTPFHKHQQQTGYKNQGPRATLNNLAMAANVAVTPGQISKLHGLLPTPLTPVDASIAQIATGISNLHPQNIFRNQVIAQAQMNPQLLFPLTRQQQQLLNAFNDNSHQIHGRNMDQSNIVGNKSSVDSSAGPAKSREYQAPVKILRNPKPGMHYQQNILPEKIEGTPHNSSVSTNLESKGNPNPKRFSNNSTEDFNQSGYNNCNNRNNHNHSRTAHQSNNQNSKSAMDRGNNTSNFPSKLSDAGPSVQKQQSGSSSRRSVNSASSGFDRQQNNNDFNKSQTNFRHHRKEKTVAEVRDDGPGDAYTNRQRQQNVKKIVHFKSNQQYSHEEKYKHESNDPDFPERRPIQNKKYDDGGASLMQDSGSSRSNSFKSARSDLSTSSSASFRSAPSKISGNENKERELVKAEPDIPYGVLLQIKHIHGKSFYDFAGVPIGNEATAKKIGSILQTCSKERMEVFEYNDYCMVNAPNEAGNGGEWCRAVITKIVGKVGVYLLDLGVSTIVDLKAIYKLPTELWSYRPLAIRMKCLNIKTDMDDPDVCDYFSSLVEDRIVKVKITHKVPWESFMYAGYLEVMHISKWFDVGTLLEKFQVAESVSESESTEELEKLLKVESASDNTLSCFVGGTVQAQVSYAVSVNEFYVSTKESIKRRFKIEQKLNNPGILSKCKPIACMSDLAYPLFTLGDEADEMLVRLKVLELEGPESAIVQKIDYGEVLTVRIAELKKLPNDLLEASCVFKCSLPVKPPPKSRSRSAQPKAYDDLTSFLVKLYDHPVMLFVYSIENSNTHIVELALENNLTGCAYSFVKNGWVVLSYPVDLNCFKNTDGKEDKP